MKPPWAAGVASASRRVSGSGPRADRGAVTVFMSRVDAGSLAQTSSRSARPPSCFPSGIIVTHGRGLRSAGGPPEAAVARGSDLAPRGHSHGVSAPRRGAAVPSVGPTPENAARRAVRGVAPSPACLRCGRQSVPGALGTPHPASHQVHVAADRPSGPREPGTGPAACGDPARPGLPLPSATAPQCPLSRVSTSGSRGRGASPHGPPPVPPAGAAAGPRPGRPVQSTAEWGPALMARGPPSAPGTWPCSRRPPLCFSTVHVAHGLPGLEAEFVLRSGHCVVDLVSVQIGDLRCKCPAATRGTWSSPPQTICPPPRVPAHPSLSPAVSPWSAK